MPGIVGQREKVFTAVHVNAVSGCALDKPEAHPGHARGAACLTTHAGAVVEVAALHGTRAFAFDATFTPTLVGGVVATSTSSSGIGVPVAQDPRLTLVMDRLDSNGNGQVQERELEAFFHTERGLSHEQAAAEARRFIHGFNLDSDNSVSLQELREGLARMPPAQAEGWIVDKLRRTSERVYHITGSEDADASAADATTTTTATATATLPLVEALFNAVLAPCLANWLSANVLMLGSEKGTAKAQALFGASPSDKDGSISGSGGGGGGRRSSGDSGGSGGYDDKGFFCRVLSRVLRRLGELKAASPPAAGVEFQVVVSFLAAPDGKNSKELVDLLRLPSQRGAKCAVLSEEGTGFPVVANVTRVALTTVDDFREHWQAALQRLRVTVLPQEEVRPLIPADGGGVRW
jgi:hypothetical protein